jgi:uncharacterized protein (DUF1810 family)
MTDNDPFDLNRFVEAQAPVIDTVRLELKRGKKQSHWMWFVFPQIAGLGFSSMAQKYAISSVEEARAYLAHPILGDRLRESVEQVLELEDCSAHQIFGHPDDMKFRSSLTLFSEASGEEVFLRTLDEYFDGSPDPATLEILTRVRLQR